MAFDLFRQPSMNQPPQRHLFVVGFARSGTSLLYNFLNLHPKIKLLFEADLLNQSLVKMALLSGQKWWERLDFYNSTCRRHKLLSQPSWEKVTSTKMAADELYRQFGGSESLYIGEKSPVYYNCLPRLAREFPDAKFIIIWRNPHNVISSMSQAGEKDYFFSAQSLPLRMLIGFERMQADVLSLRTQGTAVFDLCYEDLVESPEIWLKSICAFLEIPFDPGMLELDRADCSMYPPGEHHLKVKSGRLMRTDRSKEPATNIVQKKIPRYISRWRAIFWDRLATKRYWFNSGEHISALEVASDRLRYNLLVFYAEQLTPFIYGFFPLRLLKAYRSRREKTFAASSPSRSEAARSTTKHALKISVITPSYKQLPWLKLCTASIADQEGVNVEHIIQDAQSGPELEAWVRQNSQAELFVECDCGMYDAINRGFARASGDIVCWLNSDEQYLEGALAKVARYFEDHPEIDILFGDALLVSNTGALLSYRRTVMPDLLHIQNVHLNTLSCATFLRRSVLERGFKLETRWKAIADAVFIADLIRAGLPMGVLNEPLAVFTITDSNLGQTGLAHDEAKRWRKESANNHLISRLYYIARHRFSKMLHGAYLPRAQATNLYSLQSPHQRVAQEAQLVGFSWPKNEST
jgi:glycosyltransferase involved in cell wall biosynthesis